MTALMDALRTSPLPSIANLYVQTYKDYKVGGKRFTRGKCFRV